MYIENVTLKSVPADSLVLPVEEGTILTKNGTIPADLSQAYGIVPQKITSIPPTQMIYLAVAGTIDLKLNNVSFTEEEMQALGKDFNFVPGDEGGGNPNRVETITGTAADPWGDVDPSTLHEKMRNGDASVSVSFDSTAIGGSTYYQNLFAAPDYFTIEGAVPGDGSSTECYAVDWNTDGTVLSAAQYTTGTYVDISAYLALITTVFTIIWHPLPDQS